MGTSLSPSAITGLTSLLVVFFITVPTLRNLLDRTRSKPKGSDDGSTYKRYEDADGIATEKSQKQYSATVPKYLTLLGSVVGFLASLTLGTFSSVHQVQNLYLEDWLIFAIWVRIVLLRARLHH